ncbi:disks large homolog 4-like isoform 2-T2 [Spinachia spinachia]
MLANKAWQQERRQVFPDREGVCCRSDGAGKQAEDIRPPVEDGGGRLSERDASARRFRHHRGECKDGRELLRHRALAARTGLHGATDVQISTAGHSKAFGTENSLPQDSFVSHGPLRINVSGQSGSLGISIAGGRGSLPYKHYDEGIYISRVNRGGASEKAGVHVGDGLLEVNGLNMQAATHHEAVSALRNAGSCVDMIVLREKPPPPREVCDREEPCGQDSGGPMGKQLMMERREDCLPVKIEADVCNGNGISDLESKLNRTWSEMEALKKNDSLQGGKHTMSIPRIILTHPSTSDEDVELFSQIPSREALHEADTPDKRRCFDSAFHPP